MAALTLLDVMRLFFSRSNVSCHASSMTKVDETRCGTSKVRQSFLAPTPSNIDPQYISEVSPTFPSPFHSKDILHCYFNFSSDKQASFLFAFDRLADRAKLSCPKHHIPVLPHREAFSFQGSRSNAARSQIISLPWLQCSNCSTVLR